VLAVGRVVSVPAVVCVVVGLAENVVGGDAVVVSDCVCDVVAGVVCSGLVVVEAFCNDVDVEGLVVVVVGTGVDVVLVVDAELIKVLLDFELDVKGTAGVVPVVVFLVVVGLVVTTVDGFAVVGLGLEVFLTVVVLDVVVGLRDVVVLAVVLTDVIVLAVVRLAVVVVVAGLVDVVLTVVLLEGLTVVFEVTGLVVVFFDFVVVVGLTVVFLDVVLVIGLTVVLDFVVDLTDEVVILAVVLVVGVVVFAVVGFWEVWAFCFVRK
jgi:hypothetical protein